MFSATYCLQACTLHTPLIWVLALCLDLAQLLVTSTLLDDMVLDAD